LDQTGSNRIEFGIENGVLDGFKVEQFGVLEAIRPEGASTMVAMVEPLGELTIDVVHEAGDIKQIVVELLPIGVVPVTGFQAPQAAETESGTVVEFVTREFAIGFEEHDRVKVIPHEFERGKTAEVEFEVALEQGEKLAGHLALSEGEILRISGNAIEEVIEGRL
jgi:hypothetical protein